MTKWTINTNVKMIWFIFIFLFIGGMIIFVITNPIYIRDRNSDEIDVGKLLLATLIVSSFGVVIIWLISILIRRPPQSNNDRQELIDIKQSDSIITTAKD